MDSSWLDWLPVAVATVASLVGVLVAIGQLTSASRLRRRATFWREQLQGTDVPQDYAVAQSFHREATARLVALQAYPGWKLFMWVSVALLGAYALGTVAFITGSLSTDGLTFPNLKDQGVDPFLTLVAVWPLFGLSLYNSCTVIVQRRLLSRRYLQGLDLSTKRKFNKLGKEITDGVDLKQTGWAQIRAFLFCGGMYLLISGVSFASGLQIEEPSAAAEIPAWWYPLVFVGVFLVIQGVEPVVDMFNQERDDWEHPRNLPSHAEAPQDERETWMKRLVGWRPQHSPPTKR